MAFTLTTKQVVATIVKVDGKALRTAIQAASINVLGHAMEYGHSPLAGALDDRMNISPMMRRHAPAVQKFLTTFGPFNFSKDTGYVFSKAKRDALNEESYDFDEYTAGLPMWDDVVKAEKKETTFDTFKEVEKLIVRATKKEAEGNCIDAEMIAFLTALCGQYAGRKIIAAAQATAAAEVEAEAARVAAENAELAALLTEAGVEELTS